PMAALTRPGRVLSAHITMSLASIEGFVLALVHPRYSCAGRQLLRGRERVDLYRFQILGWGGYHGESKELAFSKIPLSRIEN
ncbi:MAG: hypothetical protein WBA43_00900, partial [Elainellaceae cyanobacterium]